MFVICDDLTTKMLHKTRSINYLKPDALVQACGKFIFYVQFRRSEEEKNYTRN